MSSLSAVDAAEYLDVSRQTLYAYVSRGLLVSEPSARRAERQEPAAASLRWGTPVLESALTLIDRGGLFYRGRNAVELSRTATFEEVTALLWNTESEGLFPMTSV